MEMAVENAAGSRRNNPQESILNELAAFIGHPEAGERRAVI
jgi:hypothetical protein